MSTSERRLHNRILELAAVALDFRLAPAETADLEGHLAACPTCARGAAALRADTAALRRPAPLLPSRRVDDAVHAAIAGRDPRTSPQRLLVLVAATALLLVALLGVAAAGSFVLRSWPFVPTVVVPTPSAPAVVVIPSPSAAPVWQIGSIPPMFPGGMAVPVAIAAGPIRFAVVGAREFEDMQAPSGGTAGSWGSEDGLAWELATKNTALAIGDSIYVDGPNPGMVDVTWGPSGYVAIGWVEDGTAVVAGAWRSPDAVTWERSDFPGTATAHLAAVTWSGSSYVVVGTMYEKDSPRAAVWLSADGASWRRAPDSAAFDIGGYHWVPGGTGACGPSDVTANSDGELLAVGFGCEAAGANDTYAGWPFAVASTDGETWTSVPVPELTGPGAGSPAFAAAAASGARFVAVAGPGDQPSVLVGNGADWRLIEPAGIPSFSRIIAYREGFLALSIEGDTISLWSSTDGAVWTAVEGVPQPSDVTALHDVDLATNGAHVVIAGYAEVSSSAGYSAFSIVGSPQAPQAVPATPTPSPSVQPAPAWLPAPGALPVASGTAQLAAGPDGGTYVVVSSVRDGAAVQRDRSVLALLDPSGEPRTGWPVAADGWSCASPDGTAWPPEVADDGSVTLTCLSWETPDGNVRTSASRFDAAGTLLASWSYDGESSGRPRVVDGRLLVIAQQVTEQEVTGNDGQAETRSTAAYWLEEVAGDGTRRSGVRLDVGEVGWPVVLGPDGTAYHVDMAQGVITAFDLDGRLAGFPARLDGSLSALGFGPDGRVYVIVAPEAQGSSSLVVLARDGSTAARSDTLPLDGTIAYSGAGPGGRPMAPLVADDGTAFVIGEAADHTVVYAVDPSGAVKSGWPYRADTAVQWQGTCPAETAGCGVWRATPAVGPDGIVYLPLAAPDAQVGGSVAAIGRDGQAVAGWPMHLARRGAEFWAAAVGSGDVAWAVAVEPEAGGGSSATVLAFSADGTVRSRITVVDPKAGS